MSGGSPSPAKGVTPNPITPLHFSHTRTQTHTECSLIHANYIPPIKPSIYYFIPRMVCLFGPFLSDPKKTNSLLSPPRVPILRSSHCFLINPGNLLLFAVTANDSARPGEGGHIYTQCRAQMKWPFHNLLWCLLLFHRNYKLRPPTAGTITPLAL